jgi:integrase
VACRKGRDAVDRYASSPAVHPAGLNTTGAGGEFVRRNVALLCEAPQGREGRPSKSLTLQQATKLLAVAEGTSMNAYIVLALLIGARTEELRALTWDRLDLDGDPPTIQVWRSVRRDGRMKTARSRRTLELPNQCVEALRDHKAEQVEKRRQAGDSWSELGLVFCTRQGSALDAANVRRSFRLVARAAGRPQGMDSARVAAQFRVLAIKLWGDHRGDRTLSRPWKHERHGAGVPEGTAPRSSQWGARHQRALDGDAKQ